MDRTKLTVRFDNTDGISPEEAMRLTKGATEMSWDDLFEKCDRYKTALLKIYGRLPSYLGQSETSENPCLRRIADEALKGEG